MDAFAWPLALVVCVIAFLLLFRSPVTDLIRRARRVGYGDKAIDLTTESSASVAERQKNLEATPSEKNSAATVPASDTLPPPIDVYASMEEEIQKSLAADEKSSTSSKIAWLIRGVVHWRFARNHEIIYRLILGSQIELLLQANTTSPPNMDQAQATMYESAKAAYPDIYAKFPFEAWLNYPINVGLLTKEPAEAGSEILKITPLGKHFLHYLVENSLTSRKIG
jgi:hypothetical protein